MQAGVEDLLPQTTEMSQIYKHSGTEIRSPENPASRKVWKTLGQTIGSGLEFIDGGPLCHARDPYPLLRALFRSQGEDSISVLMEDGRT